MKAEFKGAPRFNNCWSDPNAWFGGTVPVSDRELKVQLDVESTEDLGSAKAPFFTDDVIGVAGKLGFPSIEVSGFLHADTIRNSPSSKRMAAPSSPTNSRTSPSSPR